MRTAKTMIQRAVIAVFAASLLYPLGLLIFMPSKYAERMATADTTPGQWHKFVALTHDIDPNAWAFVWRDESNDQEKWAVAAYQSLESALSEQNPEAKKYVCEKYKDYKSLETFRAKHCAVSSVQG